MFQKFFLQKSGNRMKLPGVTTLFYDSSMSLRLKPSRSTAGEGPVWVLKKSVIPGDLVGL